MKRIAFLICGLVLVVANLAVVNTAEARRQRWSNYTTYTRPVAAIPTTENGTVANASPSVNGTDSTEVTTASATSTSSVSYSTATAQGVANIMAKYNQVGHWGGNPGYEGCGCGATKEAAYAICCYGNSGMATVDVGYAQGANGMWYCCRRYR